MQAMSSPLADLQDSVSALHVTLRHLCRALEGNLGTWPTGDRLVHAHAPAEHHKVARVRRPHRLPRDPCYAHDARMVMYIQQD